jgi:hypothetical protein
MAASLKGIFVLGLLLIFVSYSAFAHKPASIGGVFPTAQQALRMENIDVSQVVYSPLSEANPQLWLTFDATAGTTLDVSLGLPVLDRLADYRPNLAVLGPGLPAVDLPIDIPPDVGGTVFESATAGAPRFFHEPITGTDSWILLEDSVTLPETGTYYVVAYPSGTQVDKLWVAIGTREQFGLRDLLNFPAIVREARDFHEVSGAPAWVRTVRNVAVAAVAVAIIAWLGLTGR